MITEDQMQRLAGVTTAVGELSGKVRMLEEICNKATYTAQSMIDTGANAVEGAVDGALMEQVFAMNYATALAGVDQAMLAIWRPS